MFACVSVLLAHKGLLRVGELLRLKVSDVVFQAKNVLLLRLQETKTGRDQPVRFRSPLVTRLLRALIDRSGGSEEAFLIGISYNKPRA